MHLNNLRISTSLPDLNITLKESEQLENIRAGLPYPAFWNTSKLLAKEYSCISQKLRNSLSLPCLSQPLLLVKPTKPQEKSDTKYEEVACHWFYYSPEGLDSVWIPFSLWDSCHLEEMHQEGTSIIIPTDGGRYDVNLVTRKRYAVYWEEEPASVIRASWFYKGPFDTNYIPYSEAIAATIESAYQQAVLSDTWHTRLEFSNGDLFILNGPNLFVHQSFSSMGVDVEGQDYLLYNVRRGLGDVVEIVDGEADPVSILTFIVHGIGSVYDMKLRKLVPCVNDFRKMMSEMEKQYKRNDNHNGRIEVIPVSWHHHLHGSKTGLDEKLDTIILDSIPKIRNITKDTLLDVLYYTSPKYSKLILEIVQTELNRLYKIFKQRNPQFEGKISLIGHSLGSIILFDLLQLQAGHVIDNDEIPLDLFAKFNVPIELNDNIMRMFKSLKIPSSSTLQLDFLPENLFALGSPIGLFLAVRGIDLCEDTSLPNCPHVYNIFHPFDPIAFRIEPLVNPRFKDIRPILLPHHKGRKRLHLEFRDAVQKFALEMKNKVIETIKLTAESFSLFSYIQSSFSRLLIGTSEVTTETPSNDEYMSVESETLDENISIGRLNSGRRIDYVLQESPLETVNEYLFALSSHLCYWESEDTILFIVKRLYNKACRITRPN